MNRDFEHLVASDGLAPEEDARLRRVHELLLAAGAPPELPATLENQPRAPSANENVVTLPAKRRSPVLVALLAATIAVACFAGGYFVANQSRGAGNHDVRVVSLQGAGQQKSLASLHIGPADSNGNRPIRLTVTGLPPLAREYASYYLMLWQNHKATLLCGIFEVGADGPTTVSFSVPYAITNGTRWVVTEVNPGVRFPGRVVMTTI
ncbi:MAG TPA: hypothetical protein VNC40_01240 [Gaiellaceae bacterium]|nr:hypothetical protein [Gaiellaceae bacterium]